MLCSRCNVYPVSSRKGVAAGLCCNRCPDHGPWCSSRTKEAKQARPAKRLPSKPPNAVLPPCKRAKGQDVPRSADPPPVATLAPQQLPQLACSEVRNLSEELRKAKDDPELRAARKAQEEAVARDYEAKRKWEESTKFLAIGGQATMDVEAKTSALQRSEAELRKAQEALEAAETSASAGSKGSDQPIDESSTPVGASEEQVATQKPGPNLAAARRAVQLAERRVVQDRCAVEKAQELRLMDEQRKALQREREKHEEELRKALHKVKAINTEIQRNGSQHPELHAPFIAVHGSPQQLASARRLGEVEACLSGEWQAAVELQKPHVEISIPVRLIAPILAAEPPAEAADPVATNQVLRLNGIQGSSGAKDVPETAYAIVSLERAAEISAIPHERPPKPRALSLLRAWLGLEGHMRLSNEVSEVLDRLLGQPRRLAAGGRDEAKDSQVPVPEGLQANLRCYQARGFSWMAANVRNGLGCLLADDMGLGKTLQTISLVLHLKAEGQLARPALIVAPLSVLSNWASELAKWAPSLSCCIYHGPNRLLPKNCLKEAFSTQNGAVVDVILTTYHLVRDDLRLLLEKAQFAAMVLDEAQAIKNRVSQITRAVLELAAQSVGSVRIALTGTPVENRLSELHSIFNFVLPGYLGAARDFEKEFSKPLEKDASPETESLRSALRSRLITAIRPFVLRRCKSDEAVASDLPAKIELLHTVMLTSGQRRLYEAVQKKELDRVLGAAEERLRLEQIGSENAEEGSTEATNPAPISSVRAREVLSTLHALQQICNHPQALGSKHWPADLQRQAPDFGKSAENSGKMARLLALLEEVLSPRDAGREGEKVLIFTQYVHTVQLLQMTIEKAFPSHKALAVHGGLGMVEREELIQRFKTEPRCSVLIMTLGTGGVGLNLAAASHVVHYDRCWNPAKEAQATDRAHRIGQIRTVVVHRLISQGTLEERLAQELQRKSQLAKEVIPSDSTPTDINTFSVQELMDLLKMGFQDSEEPVPRLSS